jgi:DNA-binding IclR family transcriptional regulator
MPTQSVDRAIAVLKAYSVSEPVLGVTELSNRLGLHKSTVHRLLASLEIGGLVERDPRSRKYRLGMRLIELGNTVLGSRRLPQVVLPYLRYLADTVEEMSYMAVSGGDATLAVVQVPSPHLVQSVSWLARGPLHATSSGKIFLSQMSEEELERLLAKGLPRLTPKTITDPAALRDELRRVREEGYATAFEEYEEGENAIATPIARADQKAIAAISLVGPTYRFTREKVMKSADVINGVAGTISRNLEPPPVDMVD